VDLAHEARAEALDRIGAGLVGRLAAVPVGARFLGRDRAEAHARDRQRGLHARAEHDGDGAVDLVRAAREPREHRQRVGAVARLAEDRAVDDDVGVGAEHRQRLRRSRGAGLGQRHRAGVVGRVLAGLRRLGDVGGDDFEAHADLPQQLLPPRRAGREIDLRRHRLLRRRARAPPRRWRTVVQQQPGGLHGAAPES
jgi:hypothetical protein